MSDDFSLKKPAQGGEEGGWALTLADMMTLLLCFFVLLLAIADVDQKKYKDVSDSLASAMGVDVPPKGANDTYEGAPVARRVISDQQRNIFEMQLEMARLVGRESDALKIKMRPDSVAIVLKGGFFFPSGQADLTSGARRVLGKIAPTLAKSPYQVVVEGHSDNIPIRSKQFPSNWELSSARASAVARYLLDNGFSKDRIKVLGMADTAPAYPNEDDNGNAIPANQKRNRRVVLLVYPPKNK
ncbi:OmpA/MotB family protein [Maridesulfovibrio salexigens]|uniref:OmpA/MotB domain protein n=1 Tax=Maridesulfovibrio salexigens (strain ATCC 14822 / DSM 2638 / NCIMB 8403 / VKM B-1763) TaxID=526222 RepID=C6BUW2_MARSD|nr:OmpA family protein [Maridesulfovibrio salexigens]ACS78099.1 OmpA/MotB domain protein [Maridesulfovibrio salexigens DSM 2638]